MNRAVLDGMLGFTGGVMVAASFWSLLAPAIDMSPGEGFFKVMPASIGFFFGALFLFGLDKVLPHIHINFKESEGIKTPWHRTTLLVLAITLHNIPEGLAVGVLFGGVAAGIPEASIAGAVKNIIAIGAGIIEGLNLGDNAKAALITRGISETSRLIKSSGGNYETAFGLAGIGDMSLTCSGPHSRNMAYGMHLVTKTNKNKTLDLVEGVNAVEATLVLAKKFNIELPIVNAINEILNKEGNIKEIIHKLLSRPIKNEF